MQLESIGWNDHFTSLFDHSETETIIPGRVIRSSREIFTVLCRAGETQAELPGRFYHSDEDVLFPAVGDWVALDYQGEDSPGIIVEVLPRQSCFSRKEAGGLTRQQVLAANIDSAFLVMGLDGDFNIRRLERYLTVTWDSGATPVIILNKADVCSDIATPLSEVDSVAPGVPVRLVSALTHAGLKELKPFLGFGVTIALLGSSGVGKSSLINAILARDVLEIGEVRAYDNRGRHTTTHRELIPIPGGGAIIDTPGMRELQLWTDESSLEKSFHDIDEIARACRFNDCSHTSEPGCAIKDAIDSGDIDPDRFRSYLKLRREIRFINTRRDHRARIQERAKWKKITKNARRHYKNNNGKR